MTVVRSYFFLFLILATSLALTGCEKKAATAKSWDIEVKADGGPVLGIVHVEKKTIGLADRLLMQLEATAEEGYEVTMPSMSNLPEYLALKDWRQQGRRLDEKGRTVRTTECELEPIVSGQFEVPALEFKFKKIKTAEPNDAEKVYSASTEPFTIEVTSDPNLKPEIADIEGVMDMPRQYGRLWIWLGGIAAAVLLGLAAWLLFGGRKTSAASAVFVSAHELAYQLLRELVAEDLVGQGRIKEFYERISNILRHYIENRFEIRAPERTTEEFLAELGGSSILENADKERLGAFLTHCDLVKFAKHQPQTSDIQKTFDLVKDFIEKTRSDTKVVEQTASTAGTEEGR